MTRGVCVLAGAICCAAALAVVLGPLSFPLAEGLPVAAPSEPGPGEPLPAIPQWSVSLPAASTASVTPMLDTPTGPLPPPRPLTVSAPTMVPSTVELGRQPTELNVSVQGGSGGFRYVWNDLPLCPSLNRSSFSCVPEASGLFSVSVTVTDSAGNSVQSAASLLEVIGAPRVANLVADPSIWEVGATVHLYVNLTGGMAPFNFSYSNLPPGCASHNSSEISCAPAPLPNGPQNFSVGVAVRDSFGGGGTASLKLWVYPAVSFESFAARPAILAPGAGTAILLSFVGGVRPFHVQYSGLPPGCLPKDAPALLCWPTASGTFSIQVFLTDGDQQNLSARTTLVVNPILSSSLLDNNVLGVPAWLFLPLFTALVALVAANVYVRRIPESEQRRVRPGTRRSRPSGQAARRRRLNR